MKSVVSEKGQVTIPKEVRDRLGLRAGSTIDFRAEGGALVGTKAIEEDVFRRWRGRGRLPKGLTADAYLALIRGE